MRIHAMPPDTIDTAMAKQLIQARAIQGASIVGRAGGWSVVLKLGSTQRTLTAQRSKDVRVWRSLDRCVSFMKDELGVALIDQVDASRHAADSPARKTRADAAERLRRAHEAAAHDKWFRSQVEAGLHDLDTGDVLSERAHDAHWAKRRTTLEKRIAAANQKSKLRSD